MMPSELLQHGRMEYIILGRSKTSNSKRKQFPCRISLSITISQGQAKVKALCMWFTKATGTVVKNSIGPHVVVLMKFNTRTKY
jgi:hypothetical protein